MPFELQPEPSRRPPGRARRDPRRDRPPCRRARPRRELPLREHRGAQASGYFAAPIPEELGGLGVTSVHDVLVASSRLARGDASVAIGVNMHLVSVLNVVAPLAGRRAAGDERRARAFAATLEQVAGDGIVSLRRAASGGRTSRARRRRRRAPRRAGSSPGTRSSARCRLPPTSSTPPSPSPTTAGVERYGYAMVPRRTPGRGRPRRLGRARHARLRQPLRLVRGRAAAAVGASRRLPGRRRDRSTWSRNLTAGLFHAAAGARDRRERVRERRRRARASRPSSIRTRRCSRPRASSTSPPAAQSSRAPPR